MKNAKKEFRLKINETAKEDSRPIAGAISAMRSWIRDVAIRSDEITKSIQELNLNISTITYANRLTPERCLMLKKANDSSEEKVIECQMSSDLKGDLKELLVISDIMVSNFDDLGRINDRIHLNLDRTKVDHPEIDHHVKGLRETVEMLENETEGKDVFSMLDAIETCVSHMHFIGTNTKDKCLLVKDALQAVSVDFDVTSSVSGADLEERQDVSGTDTSHMKQVIKSVTVGLVDLESVLKLTHMLIDLISEKLEI